MTGPKISILTASYNALPGLRETCRSIQTQTYGDFEHIVIDGGSSDGSRDWLVEQSAHIRWISEADGGIADALNKGLGMATGEWILVLHAEDAFMGNSALDRAVRYLDTSSEIVSFNVLFVARDGGRLWRSQGFSPKINFKTTIPHQGAFCKRELFDRVGRFDTAFRVELDYELFLRAYRLGASVDVVDVTISRMPDTGISSKLDWPSLRSRFGEERLIHQKHATGRVHSAVYAPYWLLYPAFRWLRWKISADDM